jgi:hypothetical protein
MKEGRFSTDDMEGDTAAMGSQSVRGEGIFISIAACLRNYRNQ